MSDLRVLPGQYAICRLDPFAASPSWTAGSSFTSITRTPLELSVVCGSGSVPEDVQCERGWRLLAVNGPLAFDLVGVIAKLTQVLAAASVSVFVISTFDTDYVLVRESELGSAVAALRGAGHGVELLAR